MFDMSAWRGYPIHPAIAKLALIATEGTNRSPVEHISKAHRDGIRDYIAKNKLTDKTVDCIIREAADSGDEKDREITRLQAHIQWASDELASWLIDNTDEAFEEQPEIDGARDILTEAFS